MLPLQEGEVLVNLRGITKRYGNVLANDKVNFELRRGEIHGLLGENGAGKTTLANVLSGIVRPDSGTILLNGKEVEFSSPRDAIESGIGMVHQHFMQIEPMTVTENVLLGNPGKKWHARNLRQLSKEISEFSRSARIEVDPDARIMDLSIGSKQRVEILKVLFRGADILILDEPTAVLTAVEVESFFDSLRGFSSQGKSIILIAHKLVEIISITDTVTVLRRGKLIGTRRTKSTSASELAEMMVGSDYLGGEVVREQAPREPRLNVEDLSVRDDRGVLKVDRVSFSVNSSEVVGIAGVDGNGQRELAEALMGLREPASGRIMLENRDLVNLDTKQRREIGVAFVPEDRLQAIVPEFTILENLMLTRPDDPEISKNGMLQFRKLKDMARQLMRTYSISAPNFDIQASKLSGGNIQRLIMARELSTKPRFLIASHPTRGLDLMATRFVHQNIRKLADSGSSVLVLSSDLDELMELSDRILVIHSGRIAGEFPSGSYSVREIGLSMTGVKELTT